MMEAHRLHIDLSNGGENGYEAAITKTKESLRRHSGLA